MYSNVKHFASTAILILILCVLGTNQTIFSRKKVSSTPATEDNVPQQTASFPQNEPAPHHWWYPAGIFGHNQNVAAALIPQKYPISFEAEVNPELQLTWESCKCLMRKGEDNPLQVFTQYNQPSPITLLTKPFLTKPHRPRPQQQQYNRPTYPTTTTQAPSEPPVTITENENGYVQRFILATDQIEN